MDSRNQIKYNTDLREEDGARRTHSSSLQEDSMRRSPLDSEHITEGASHHIEPKNTITSNQNQDNTSDKEMVKLQHHPSLFSSANTSSTDQQPNGISKPQTLHEKLSNQQFHIARTRSESSVSQESLFSVDSRGNRVGRHVSTKRSISPSRKKLLLATHHFAMQPTADHGSSSSSTIGRSKNRTSRISTLLEQLRGNGTPSQVRAPSIASEEDDSTSGKWSWERLKQRVKAWYIPVYDHVTPGLSDSQRQIPRYCNGQLKLWQFIVAHFGVLLLVFLIVFLPILYWVIIPQQIQAHFASAYPSKLEVQSFDITKMSDDSFTFAVRARTGAMSALPIKILLGQQQVELSVQTVQNRPNLSNLTGQIIKFEVPQMWLQLSSQLNFVFSSTLQFQDQTRLRQLIEVLSNSNDPNSVDIVCQSALMISWLGVTWYRRLPVENRFRLTSGQFDIWSIIPKSLLVPTLNGDIQAEIPRDKLIIFSDSFPFVYLDQVRIGIDDSSLYIAPLVRFENPLVVQASIPELTFRLGAEESPLVNVSIAGLNLVRGLNRLDLTLRATFFPNISSILQSAFHGSTDRRLVLQGPIGIKGASFLDVITQSLSIAIPGQNLSSIGRQITSILNIPSLEQMQSTRNALQYGSRLFAPYSFTMPRFAALPPIIFLPCTISMQLQRQQANGSAFPLTLMELHVTNVTMRSNTTHHVFESMLLSRPFMNALNPLITSQTNVTNLQLSQIRMSRLFMSSTIGMTSNGTSTMIDDLIKSQRPENLPIPIPIPDFANTSVDPFLVNEWDPISYSWSRSVFSDLSFDLPSARLCWSPSAFTRGGANPLMFISTC